MQEWMDRHMGKMLTIVGGILMVLIGIVGWFLDRTMDESDRRFSEQNQLIHTEIAARSAGDYKIEEKLNAKIESEVKTVMKNTVSIAQFNEFKDNVDDIKGNVSETNRDVKELLKSKNR